MITRLADAVRSYGVSQERIHEAIDSGYFVRDWVDPFSGKTWATVSDMFYGNKQLSSSLEIEQFAAYLMGESPFEQLPQFNEVVVKNADDIRAVLDEPRRRHYRLVEGTL